jgi:serine/threonine protein kinase
VALKVIPTFGKSQQDLQIFQKEISMIKSVDHQNIIKFFEMFEEDGNIVIVSELALTDLLDILQDGPLPLSQI